MSSLTVGFVLWVASGSLCPTNGEECRPIYEARDSFASRSECDVAAHREEKRQRKEMDENKMLHFFNVKTHMLAYCWVAGHNPNTQP